MYVCMFYGDNALKFNQAEKFTAIFIIILTISTISCAALSRFTGDESGNISIVPSRTPFPTFTATAEPTLLVIPPTDTPVPTPTPIPPTETPVPVQEEAVAESTENEADNLEEGAAEEEAEPTPVPPTDTPVPAPTQPPPPPPTDTPVPEPAGPVVGPNGVLGQITFRDGRNTYGVGEKVFVRIEATYVDAGQKPFGILGLTTSTGQFQTSWSNATINGTFTHEDGLAFPAPGNHKMWLSICFSTQSECQGPNGDWERFEPGLDVIIQ